MGGRPRDRVGEMTLFLSGIVAAALAIVGCWWFGTEK